MAAKLIPAMALIMTCSVAASAQSAARPVDPIRYTLSFPEPHTHCVEVTAEVPAAKQPELELMMAVWTPGSYLIREYERQVEGLTAAGPDGIALSVVKSAKNRWRVATGGAESITVKYRVYAREMTVRTNWVEAGFAMLNGAPTFLTLADEAPRPHEVAIVPAAGWQRAVTALPAVAGAVHRYRAPDFDTLVDSPIVVGNPTIHEFEVDGRPHLLVNEGEGGVFDGARAARDLETIVREHRRMWGSLPYERYVFFNILTLAQGGGGLEHRNSAMLMAGRFATRTRQAYLAWLELASHEYFHVWNIKRLRPAELGPFDYESENQTRSLWIAEGITDYYAELAVHRAGLSTRDEYLAALSNKIEELQTTPGRLVQPVEAASFDAWIRYYRPDENSANVSISYYTKGAVLAFLLDARIQNVTGGARSLDDVMRAAYDRFSGARGYTPDEFRELTAEVAGVDLRQFWNSAVSGTDELDYAEALTTFGLRFRAVPEARPGGKAWLGATARNDNGRLVVTQVRRATPAYDAGLNVDDEILAFDEFRVRPDRLDNRLEQYKAGDTVSLLIARRDQVMRLGVTLGNEPRRQWRLEMDPAATDAQNRRLSRWLHA